jgi:hypothetical protein
LVHSELDFQSFYLATHNGKKSTVNKSLDGSMYPG